MIFNKDKCKTCKYHGFLGSSYTSLKTTDCLICNYSGATNATCLKRVSKDEVEDRRGSDPDHCKLYENGRRIKVMKKGGTYGSAD